MSVDDSGSLSYFSQRTREPLPRRGGTFAARCRLHWQPQQRDRRLGQHVGHEHGFTLRCCASVLIREAMEFVGQTSITQDTIYDHMMATADSFLRLGHVANVSAAQSVGRY